MKKFITTKAEATTTTNDKLTNPTIGSKHAFFPTVKPMKAKRVPSKIDLFMDKIEEFMKTADKKIEDAVARAKPYAVKLVRFASKVLMQIIIWGILINIAAGFWPDLKEEIPYIYGFFDGCLHVVEEIFEWYVHWLSNIFS